MDQFILTPVYASWQNRLFKEHGWPESSVLPFTLALACVHGLLLLSHSTHLEFSIETQVKSETERWTVSFEIFPNPEMDPNATPPSTHWLSSLNKMWTTLSGHRAEHILEILGKTLIEHLPSDQVACGEFNFPGCHMSWHQENLTSSGLLTHILSQTHESTDSL